MITELARTTVTCTTCSKIVERTDVPHVVRSCPSCGRELHVAEPGDRGKGLRIEKGDRVVIRGGWLTLSLDPLKGRGHITRAGIDMLARNLFLDGITKQREDPWEHFLEQERRTDAIVNSFPPLSGLDVNRAEDGPRIMEIMLQHKGTREFYAFWGGEFFAGARRARDEGDLQSAVWCVSCAERFLAMLRFKDDLEDVVLMGNSVSRLRDVLAIWDTSQDNASEEFWQETFREHSFVLSQIFAEPVVFIQDKAYVGGMQMDRHDARFVDYVFAVESSRDAVLIEIKTPVIPLLSGEYRGHMLPSREMVGSVAQVSDYRKQLMQSMQTLAPPAHLAAFQPRAVLIAGSRAKGLAGVDASRAFDAYRATLRDVQVITFDELFRKVAILADLFGLRHTPRQHAQEPGQQGAAADDRPQAGDRG